MSTIQELMASRKADRAIRKEKELHQRANDIYQAQEYEGELWLTYNGSLVCPASMLKDEIVVSLSKMRELYIERNK